MAKKIDAYKPLCKVGFLRFWETLPISVKEHKNKLKGDLDRQIALFFIIIPLT